MTSAIPATSMARICLAVTVLMLLFGLLLPVYTDEVAWRFAARAAVDGVDRPIFANCGPNTLAVPPLFIMGLRHVSLAINLVLADPMYVRVAGVFWALVWLGLMLLLIKIISRDELERNTFTLLALPLLGLGTLPLVLVISRPDQPVLLTLTVAILVAVWGQCRWEPPSAARGFAAAWIVVLLGAVALAYHLKGVAYLPVFVACAVLSSRGRAARTGRWSAALGLVVLGAIAAPYWINRFKCLSDPVLAKQLAANSIAAGDLNASALINRLAGGINPLDYVTVIVPRGISGSNWLPPVSLDPFASHLISLGIHVAWLAAMIFAGVCLIRTVLHQRHVPISARLLLLGVTIIAVLGMWAFTQVSRNFYEAQLFLPMLIIAMVLLVRSANLSEQALGRLTKAGAAMAILAVVSQGILLGTYAPKLADSARQPGYVDAQGNSVSPFGYRALRPRITNAGKLCGIKPQQAVKHLLVDDLTYFAYMESYRPLHHLGVVSVWNGQIRDPLGYLKKQRSSGAVLGCKYLPPELRAQARQSGEFCCFGAAQLDGIHAGGDQIASSPPPGGN